MSKGHKGRYQEPEVKPATRLETETPKESASIPPSREPGKLHVELYLKAKATKLWERGGMIAFAHAKGMAFASEKSFDELFRSY